MRAAVYRSCGPPSVIKIETNFPLPIRKPNEVLVKVAATSVNPIDWKFRSGSIPFLKYILSFPRIPGGDVAGIVSESDAGSKFKAGDKVFGVSNAASANGTTAEFASVAEANLAPKPPNISFEEAAGVPLTALTAWQALEQSMPLAGKQVLVHAGAGGVGNFAVQIAKAQGAVVTTTCSSRNIVFVTKTVGADHAVDYTTQDFVAEAAKRLVQYDHVVDPVGGSYETRSLKVIKKGGHYSSVLNNGWFDEYSFKPLGFGMQAYSLISGKVASYLGGPGYHTILMQGAANRGLNQVTELLVAGKVKTIIDRVVPLEDTAKAHAYMEEKHARGKVIIKVADL